MLNVQCSMFNVQRCANCLNQDFGDLDMRISGFFRRCDVSPPTVCTTNAVWLCHSEGIYGIEMASVQCTEPEHILKPEPTQRDNL